MAKQVPKRKAANGYKLPEPIPKGEILVDIAKKKWKIGSSIGQGGFGEIYAVQEANSKSASYPYVVKIEPHENGPLFVEINFYIRNAKPKEVEEFKNKKKLKILGMPTYIGSGSHEHNRQKYRFLVLHKFGKDIWKIFLDHGRIFPVATVFKLAVQILDVLEYIHEHGYVHADIKGANILLGLAKETENQSYLVDFGLATKYQTGDTFKPNPKKAHDGTIEYLSRDAHKGVPTRRGDLEILAYNLIQWLGCTLPWEHNLSNAVKVQDTKEQLMQDVDEFLQQCFGSRNVPASLFEFLKYINTLSFNQKPDYGKIRKLFIKEIEKNGDTLTTALVFNSGRQTSPKRKTDHEETTKKKLKKEKSNEAINTKMADEKKNAEKPIPKQREKSATADDFDGYTPEMRAIAMKKFENGVKKTSSKNFKTPNKSKNESPPYGATVRNRRNVKVINYNEAVLSPK